MKSIYDIRGMPQIIASVPKGNTLLTMSYSLTIPRLSGIRQGYHSNTYSTVLIYI
jgi:hypothetical protein